MRLWHLDSTGWQYDEIVYHQVADNLIAHAGLTEKITYGAQYQPFLYQPPWYPYLLAGWFEATGKDTIYSARVLGVLLSTCSLVFAWLLVSRQRGTWIATYAVVPLAFDGWLLYVDRVSYIENLIMVVILAAFLLYQRALDRPTSMARFAAAGICFGLAGCLKYTGVYVVLAVALSWLILHRYHRGHILMMCIALVLLALDQVILAVWWGNAYLTETSVQIQRVLGLRKSGGTLTSPGALAHLLFAQYHIFAVSFVLGLGGMFFVIRYLFRCYRARSWQPLQGQSILFSWALAGMLTFGLSNLRLPQYFSLILIPLYLLFWTELTAVVTSRRVLVGMCGTAVILGLASFWLSTHAQAVNPEQSVEHYVAAHVPHDDVMIADEQIGDLLPQPYCREQQADPCLHKATYAVTWDTYLQKTQKLGDAAFDAEFAGATPLYSVSGFSGTATLWRLNAAADEPAAPVVGVDVSAFHAYAAAQAKAYGKRVLSYIRTSLHAGSAGIVWDLCDPSFYIGQVSRCSQSLPPEDVGILATEARADHLTVQLRPLIRVGPVSGWNDPSLSWEGHIRPVSGETFAKSVLAAEHPYLEIARRDHISQFVVGSELLGWHGSQWQHWLLAQARSICDCQVSYAYSTTRITSLPTVHGPAGLDYYPVTTLGASASQAAVTAAIERPLAALPAAVRVRLTLDEVSIAAEAGAYKHASNWNAGGAPEPGVQARWFTGICQAAVRYHLAGIYFYEIPLNDNLANPSAFPAFFVGTRGGTAISKCAD